MKTTMNEESVIDKMPLDDRDIGIILARRMRKYLKAKSDVAYMRDRINAGSILSKLEKPISELLTEEEKNWFYIITSACATCVYSSKSNDDTICYNGCVGNNHHRYRSGSGGLNHDVMISLLIQRIEKTLEGIPEEDDD